MKKKSILAAFFLTVVLGFSACNKLDIIGDTSVTSFEKLINIKSNQVVTNGQTGEYSIISPDGQAAFIISKDFNNTSSYDVRLEVNAQPFIEAGLDLSKLPEGMAIGDKLIVGKDLESTTIKDNSKSSLIESYRQLVKLNRRSVKYHTALDHFGIDLSDGNMFEWAKDMSTNDKDMVYALAPQVLIDAGVDPSKVKGWVFAKVATMDDKGKEIEVDKFLKPVNLDGLPK